MSIEKPLFNLRPSRIYFASDYMLAAFLAAVVAILSAYEIKVSELGLASAGALIVIFLLSPEYKKLNNLYIVTKSQVIVEQGIISRKRKSVFMNNVADISVDQNIVGRALRYGNLVLGSASGREHMELKLEGIRNPKRVAHEIEKLIKHYETGKEDKSG